MRYVVWMLFLAGCIHGPSIESYGPAHVPGGVETELDIIDTSNKVDGELLAVRDSSLVIATDSRIVEVFYPRIRDGRFSIGRRLRIGAGRAPGPRKREELTLLSRYPQGLTDANLSRLLAAYNQQELEVIR